MSDKTRAKSQIRDRDWFKQNPPDESGVWICYLRIHPKCPMLLNRTELQLEHVKSKARYPELRYDVQNLKPSCAFCNQYKGSQDLDQIGK